MAVGLGVGFGAGSGPLSSVRFPPANTTIGTITAAAARAPPATASRRVRRIRPGLALHLVEGQRRLVEVADALVELATHLGLPGVGVVVHRSSSLWLGCSSAGTRSRSAASARLHWDLTVPTEMPSTSAVSVSDSCS